MSGEVRLEAVVKRYPGVVANDGVDFEATGGEVHAIVGENGAGKTTLLRILAGATRPDAGRILLDGEPVEFRSVAAATARGVGLVHQHFTLVPRFTVLENVALGREPVLLRSLSSVREALVSLSGRLGFGVDPDARVEALSVGERQRVEILRTLLRGARILLLDEPTAVLAPGETAPLFRLLRGLADEGRTVVLVSHRLGEVLEASDRVTVMRAGKAVATVETPETEERQLARLMVGREVVLPVREEGGAEPGDVILRIEGLAADSDRGVPALRGVDLAVREGEIVGVAGIQGNGQTELVEAVLGTRPATAGSVSVGSRDLRELPVGKRLALGMAVVPEDRADTGLVPGLSAAENFALGPARGFLLRPARLRERAGAAMAALEVRPPAPDAVIESFSGGNRQKVLLARALASKPVVLVLAEPSRGLDVGATELAYAALRQAREDGAAVLLVSSNLDELLALSDRIVVLRRGRISGEVRPGETTEEELGLLMAGRGEG